MIILQYVPDGIEDINDYYGNPREDDNWFNRNMIVAELPFDLRQSWNQRPISRFHAHKRVAAAMVDALMEIESYAGIGFLRKHNLDQWGGVYNDRNKRGGDVLSIHAYGAGIDYCPLLGPFGEPSRMPYFITRAFVRRGFINLWHYDGQHNQGAKSY